ncbi:hypothetical protein EDB86DRAFT_572582 [Lactarius hatsudake]|nr:hypothetical protein EDB86DRAFT_572582 [Lactarius hatsudake]
MLTLATKCLFRSSPGVRSTYGVLVWARERETMSYALSSEQASSVGMFLALRSRTSTAHVFPGALTAAPPARQRQTRVSHRATRNSSLRSGKRFGNISKYSTVHAFFGYFQLRETVHPALLGSYAPRLLTPMSDINTPVGIWSSAAIESV